MNRHFIRLMACLGAIVCGQPAFAQSGGGTADSIDREYRQLEQTYNRLTSGDAELATLKQGLSDQRVRINRLKQQLGEAAKLKQEEQRLVQQLSNVDGQGVQQNEKGRQLEREVAKIPQRKQLLEERERINREAIEAIEASKPSARSQSQIDRLNDRIRGVNAAMQSLYRDKLQFNEDVERLNRESEEYDQKLGELESLQKSLQDALAAVRSKYQDHRPAEVELAREETRYQDMQNDYNVKKNQLNDEWRDYETQNTAFNAKLDARRRSQPVAAKPSRPNDDTELRKSREDARRAEEERRKLEGLLSDRVKAKPEKAKQDHAPGGAKAP